MLNHLDTLIAFAVVMLGVSLLMTVATQLVTNFLGLRGTNLKRGLIDLLTTVHPTCAPFAKKIAQQVLEHRIVSDSAFARLGKWASWVPFVQTWRLATAVRVEEVLGILGQLSRGTVAPPGPPATTNEAMALIVAAAGVTASPEVRAATEQVSKLVGSVAAALPTGVTVQLDRIAGQLPTSAEAARNDLKSWFNSVMDRTAARFALQARVVTVVLSILFVFLTHFDALRLLTQLSQDAEMRAKLMSSAGVLEAKAAEILKPPAAPAPAGTKAAAPAEAKTEAPKPGDVQDLKRQADSIKKTLDDTGLRLIPDPYPGLKYSAKEISGLLVAAALLSLGAPFWFNTLKNLSSLRPLLATREEKEKTQKAG
jgi:hypothetical protein